jgi:hypothetical protein
VPERKPSDSTVPLTIEVRWSSSAGGGLLAGALACVGSSRDPKQFGSNSTGADGRITFNAVPFGVPVVITAAKPDGIDRAGPLQGTQINYVAKTHSALVSLTLPAAKAATGPTCDSSIGSKAWPTAPSPSDAVQAVQQQASDLDAIQCQYARTHVTAAPSWSTINETLAKGHLRSFEANGTRLKGFSNTGARNVVVKYQDADDETSAGIGPVTPITLAPSGGFWTGSDLRNLKSVECL